MVLLCFLGNLILFRGISDTGSICKHHVFRFRYPTTSLCTSNFNSNTHTNRRIRPRGRNSNPRGNGNESHSQHTTPSSKTSSTRSIRMESLFNKRSYARRFRKTSLSRSLPLIRYFPPTNALLIETSPHQWPMQSMNLSSD